MTGTAVYIKSDGFTPKAFLNLSKEEQFDILCDNGLMENTVSDKETEQKWKDIFFEINEDFDNDIFGYTTCNLTENEVAEELYKIMKCVNYSVLFSIVNIEEKDWLHRITEYMVYMERSIATLPGTVIYWRILKDFFEEDGVVRSKSKQLLQFILKRDEIICHHTFYDEVHVFTESFPFKPLGIEKYHIPEIISLLELYPQGKLNRYISERFPTVEKTLSRERIKAILYGHLEIALGEFKVEELWENGDSEVIMKFLTDCTIHESKITEREIMRPEDAVYNKVIKQWLHSQVKLIHKLNEIKRFKLNHSANTNEPKTTGHHAKYYALYYHMLIKTGKTEPFQRNENDKLPKSEIMTFAENRFHGISTQQFYNYYRDLEDMVNKTSIARSYPNFKEIVAEISGNDADILHHLKEYPG